VERYDILPRTIALLLGLALFAERAALRPLAARLAMCQILLPGWHAALFLIDWPEDADKSQSAHHALDCSQHNDSTAMLLHLAIVFRAIAAVLMHACLTGGTIRRQIPRHAVALSLNLSACRRLHNTTWPAPDTS
jgi:ABC-type Fe3+ transport system permease subunit